MSMSTVSPPTTRRATLDDLGRVDGKAELIGGKIVREVAADHFPNHVASRIVRSLDDHAEAPGQGVAFTGTMGFAVPELPSGRESFSPDASYFVGPLPDNLMGFVEGAPTFAVEVRSESDYRAAAEKSMTAKRVDYFLAGTSVAWDVDLVARCVRKYRADSPDLPIVFSQGEQGDAEPAVPGWRLPVDRLFS